MKRTNVAVIDIGKTNAKLALVDLSDLSEIAVVTRPNNVLNGHPWPHFDVEGHWDFLLEALASFHASHGVHAISVTTHGACAALIGADGQLAAPILDYEHSGPDEVAKDYNAIRPEFAETGSPRLEMGLNIGAQLYWQFQTDPTLKERTQTIVTYPQYWGHRLTGIAATDVTSLGCHTDLWNPHKGCFSSLVDRLGIADKIAPARPSGDILGTILPEIAHRTGLPQGTQVYCGIHDSNASLVPHILSQQTPFSVVSTGTWVIAMAMAGKPVTLDPARDTLINVNAYGAPVPSARFMGGREHDLATAGPYDTPTAADMAEVLRAGILLLPAVVANSGPFAGQSARWVGAEPPIGSPARGAAVAFYLALVTAHCLSLIGHDGPIIVEGPFARNECYCTMLAATTGSEVRAMTGTTGTSQGAALLASNQPHQPAASNVHLPRTGQLNALMQRYATLWADHAGV
ncbi:FGGY-family carbohydrate kinase [Actibacterium lipolyticum]|uniref:L-fuculokinase n=1 Tax=Actibacterium lipolyticum TaxID=1524263 RepID=A0A238KFA5_9RHOB|nr:FGGY-family carbohydrate kinase [Actibacterium lipolyticum]SMX41519.1 L-fuculokinase [Actibacterium lipolyticum]